MRLSDCPIRGGCVQWYMRTQSYPSDVTDPQWALIEPHLPVYPGGRDKVPVSNLCDEHQLSLTLFYLWQKTFFENGATAFEHAGPRGQQLQDVKDRKIAQLGAKLVKKNEV